MIKGAPVISEATAIPEASVTTEVQKYPAEVLRCSCSCFCGDQVQKLLLRFCFVGTLDLVIGHVGLYFCPGGEVDAVELLHVELEAARVLGDHI